MKILSKEVAQYYQIHSLNRGHVIFTSLISYNGKMLFFNSHLDRLLRGADFLFPNAGWITNHEKIRRYAEEVSRENKSDFYIRLTIFDDFLHLEQRAFEIYPETITVTSALKVKTSDLIPPYVKTSNYLEADLELRKAKLKNFDDVLFFDNSQNVTEASTSNIFIVTAEGSIKTPPLSSMVLEGITRKELLERLKKEGFQVEESPISKAELEKAREIWFTNAVKGVRFVTQFDERVFERKDSIYDRVVALFGRYGELA